ncbi:hypothetical protein TSUD_144720 [Trifolium subterraneum]|uniref:DUF1639 domain-containing protein n=2 Tax=Trifolium TaxID=3898 RepID=A0A2Z6MPA5_TRISU|nr:hypothetical protein TSUD_144720 [Trifolium subterraneum]
MEPERTKPLHNFSLPCLKWGSQKLLRCVNNNSNINNDSSPLIINPNSSQNDPIRKNDESVDAVRERIMGDLRVAATKLKVSIFEENAVVGNENGVVGGSNGAIRPWNLRTRRAACKAPPLPSPPIPPVRDDGRRFFDVGSSTPSSPMVMKKKKMVMVNEKVKFSVSLSKEEVEEDFWALVGTRPPRRPKKRPRIVQRQLNTLLPGMWLAEVTPDSYKVAEVPE